MAIEQQFSDIVKNHPELIKQERTIEQQPATTTPKINPFAKLKQKTIETQTTAQPESKSTEGVITEKPVKIAKMVVVDEDNNDDDPALIAVADKPYEDKTEKPTKRTRSSRTESKKEKVEVKEPEKKKEPIPEDTVQGGKTSEVKETEEVSKDIIDYSAEEDKEPDYFKNNVELLRQKYVHQEFEQFEQDLLKRLEDIKITPDMNTGMVKVRLAEISTLRFEILKHRINVKMLLQSPLDKEHGDVYASAKIKAKGSNETERKSSYFSYLKNFPVKDKTVDISFITTVLDMYNILFDAVLVELKVKQDILVTYTGNLKLDAVVS